MRYYEVNFDGIVGPTHNYSGLSYGNLASMGSKEQSSNPKNAALQGLEKMKFLADLGLKQAVIPPHERPHIPTLRKLGFSGSSRHLPEKVFKENPDLLMQCSSAASMWTANCATITTSIDTIDEIVHITPANLATQFHRAIETPQTAKLLQTIFKDPVYFAHHYPLPDGTLFADEGSANQIRFCESHQGIGVHFFVYGKNDLTELDSPETYPARQSFEASEAITRLHKIHSKRKLFAQQNPKAIDAGIFHNDVISMGNENFFMYHEDAFVQSPKLINDIRAKVADVCETDMTFIKVKEKVITLNQAIKSYLFNSQIVTLPDDSMSIIAPRECERFTAVREFLNEISEKPETPIRDIHFVDLTESMANGGGPACLRIRVLLSEKELAAMNQGVLLTERLYERLKNWINSHYRDKLAPSDLADPNLVDETQEALHELTRILELGNIYNFQKT